MAAQISPGHFVCAKPLKATNFNGYSNWSVGDVVGTFKDLECGGTVYTTR